MTLTNEVQGKTLQSQWKSALFDGDEISVDKICDFWDKKFNILRDPVSFNSKLIISYYPKTFNRADFLITENQFSAIKEKLKLTKKVYPHLPFPERWRNDF